jgi:hypothetical protein
MLGNTSAGTTQGPTLFNQSFNASGIAERMNQLRRLDRYQKELAKITRARNIPARTGLPRISVAGHNGMTCPYRPTGLLAYKNRKEKSAEK